MLEVLGTESRLWSITMRSKEVVLETLNPFGTVAVTSS